MKGTLFSVDFTENNSGNPLFLEMNTDTYVYDDFLDNVCDWSGFITLLQSESIDTVSVVYKPDFHLNVVNHLSESLHSSASFVTSFTKHEEFQYDIYPTPIVDASNKFILRLAYDENAIIDSTYAKNDFNGLKLFYDYTASNDAVPFYHSSSDHGEINTLEYSLNQSNVPDLVIKGIESSDSARINFAKVGAISGSMTGSEYDSSRILDFVQSISSSEMAQNYMLSSESLTNEHASSLRHYGIVYGTDLDVLHLGEYRVLSTLSLPTDEQFGRDADITTEYILPVKHYYEYSTSPLHKQASRGIFETETVVLSDNSTVSIETITTGSVVKAFDIPTLPSESNIATSNYLLWSHDGGTLPSGSALTSSVVEQIITHDLHDAILAEINISGSDYIYAAPTSPLLVYDSGSDEIKFKLITQVDKTNDYALGDNSKKIPILSIKNVVLNENTGSLYDLNVEPVDNFLIGEVSYFSGIFHNYKLKPQF